MHLRSPFALSASACLWFLILITQWRSTAAAENLPGKLISETSPTDDFQPTQNRRTMEFREAGLDPRKLIPDLLVRQYTCRSGYGYCAVGSYCCPIGTRCCAGLGCCYSGENCCADGGCCSSGYNCVIVSGVIGCCPVGRTCSGLSNQCADAGYYPCPNDTYCCPSGDTCYRDAQGNPRCQGGGPTYVPPPTTTYYTYTSTYTPTTTTSTPRPISTSTSPSLSPSPTTTRSSSVPSTSNVTVSATDPSITYVGTWTNTTSSCSSVAVSKQCTGSGNSVQYTFVGTAIYLTVSLDSDSGLYSITLDGVTVQLDGYSTIAVACNVSWHQSNLSNAPHTLTINTLGASPRAASGSTGTFEFVNFIVWKQATASSSSTTGGGTLTVSSSASSEPEQTSSASSRLGIPDARLFIVSVLVALIFV